MNQQASQNIKSATVDAVIIRADGTRVNLGTIARYDAPEHKLTKALRSLRRVLSGVFSWQH